MLVGPIFLPFAGSASTAGFPTLGRHNGGSPARDRFLRIPWGDTLRGALVHCWTAVVDNPNFLRLGYLLLLERREKSPTARGMFQRIRRHTLGLYTDWFAGALPAELTAERPELPANLARLMMAFSDGLLVSFQVHEPPWDPRRFADLVVTMLEAGARCPRVPSRARPSAGSGA